MSVFRGETSCRRVIVAEQPSRVAPLPRQLSAAAASHDNFERGRGEGGRRRWRRGGGGERRQLLGSDPPEDVR